MCFNAVPTSSNISFLYGPLEAGYTPRERKRPGRKKWAQFGQGEDESPESIAQRESNVQDHELSAVGDNIKILWRELRKKSREQKQEVVMAHKNSQHDFDIDDKRTTTRVKRKKLSNEACRVDATKLLFDNKSFTRTVENIYNSSFLVLGTGQKFNAGIGIRSYEEAMKFKNTGINDLGPGPVLYPTKAQGDWAKNYDTSDDEHKMAPANTRKVHHTQAIVGLNMKDWRRMCRVFECRENNATCLRGANTRSVLETLVDRSDLGEKESLSAQASPPIVTQLENETFEDDIQSSWFGDAITQSFCDPLAPAASAAPAVTPEKESPPSPLSDLIVESQLEMELPEYDNNSKMGVDNPTIQNPFFYCGRDDQSEDPSESILSNQSNGVRRKLLANKAKYDELSSQSIEKLRGGMECGRDIPLGSCQEDSKSAARRKLEPAAKDLTSRTDTYAGRDDHATKQESQDDMICIDLCDVDDVKNEQNFNEESEEKMVCIDLCNQMDETEISSDQALYRIENGVIVID